LVVVVLLGAAASLLAAGLGLVDDELEELLDLELLFV